MDESLFRENGTVELQVAMQDSHDSMQQKMGKLSLEANPNDNQIGGRPGVQGIIETIGDSGHDAD